MIRNRGENIWSGQGVLGEFGYDLNLRHKKLGSMSLHTLYPLCMWIMSQIGQSKVNICPGHVISDRRHGHYRAALTIPLYTSTLYQWIVYSGCVSRDNKLCFPRGGDNFGTINLTKCLGLMSFQFPRGSWLWSPPPLFHGCMNTIYTYSYQHLNFYKSILKKNVYKYFFFSSKYLCLPGHAQCKASKQGFTTVVGRTTHNICRPSAPYIQL